MHQQLLELERDLREQQAVGKLYDHVLHNVICHIDGHRYYGREALLAHWLGELHSLGDQTLQTHSGFSTEAKNDHAHWVLSRAEISAQHNGESYCLPQASGKTLAYRNQSLSLVAQGRIVEQWSFNDQLHIALQLGLDIETQASKQAPQSSPWSLGEIASGLGQTGPLESETFSSSESSEAKCEQSHEGLIQDWLSAMNRHDFQSLEKCYHSQANMHGPGGRKLDDCKAIKRFYLSLQAAFPNGHWQSVQFIANEQEDRIALLWRLDGDHSGPGFSSPPSGKRIAIHGLSEWHIVDGKIKQEWTLFNEIDLLQQILSEPSVANNSL